MALAAKKVALKTAAAKGAPAAAAAAPHPAGAVQVGLHRVLRAAAQMQQHPIVKYLSTELMLAVPSAVQSGGHR